MVESDLAIYNLLLRLDSTVGQNRNCLSLEPINSGDRGRRRPVVGRAGIDKEGISQILEVSCSHALNIALLASVDCPSDHAVKGIFHAF